MIKSIAQKSNLLIATVASVLLVLLLSLNPTPALADSVTGPGNTMNYPLHLNLKDGQMWKIELTNIDYSGLTDYLGSGEKAFQFYVQEWDGGISDWALIGVQVHKENYAAAFQLFSDTYPHGPWTVQRTHGVNAPDWPFQTPFDLRLIMQHDGSAFIVWAYFRVPGNPNYSNWTLFYECRIDVLGPAVIPVISALLDNANVQVQIDGQSDGTVTFDPPTVSVIYWKDYNGEDPGGYMPDIDQNQDFDKVIVRSEETDPNVSCQANWLPYPDSHASGGSITYSDTATDSCTFTFTGTSIRYIGTPSNNKGIASVYIDDQYQTDVDLYSPTLKYQQVLYTNTNLTPGLHTIKIVVTGNKNPLSSLHRIDVDAFDVDDIEKEYCAPVAEANSLWWLNKKDPTLEIFGDPYTGTGYAGGDINGDGIADILDLVQELATMMNTNVNHTGTTVEDEQTGIDAFLAKYQLGNKLYEHTVYDPEFSYIEEEVERSQDVKLDLGFWNILACDGAPGTGSIVWQRVGGHAVTVAGVDSPNFLLAISDPDKDAAESGAPGVVRPLPGGHPAHAGDPSIHNNEMFASHDIYTVVPSASPGGIWALKNYPGKVNFPTQEWGQPTPTPWPPDFYPCEESMIITEIEAAVIVSPIICGNGNVDPGEECDDGNTNNGDGCSSTCIIEFCGDGTVQQGLGEQCDDGNNTSGDGCSSTCIIESCGDGITQQGLGEECDDGNNVSEDGCSATCQWEVIVVDPNGGEVIPSGSNYPIDWSTPVGSTAVKFDVEYSMNNGAIWNLIASKVAGSSYNWAVPKPPKNKPNCLVRVTGYDASNVMVDDDISNAKFKIEVVKVTSPNGGENWKVGSTHAITWTTNGTKTPVKKAKLFYTYNGGANWILIYTFLNSNPGTYNWTVPAASSANCKVKVVLKNKLGNTIGTDMSDSTFTISSP